MPADAMANVRSDGSSRLTIVWFRQDLRLDDNPALTHAAQSGSVLPLFIDTTEYQKAWLPGQASRWWLGESLLSLDAALRARGSRLILQKGDAAETLLKLVRRSGATAVVWNNRYEPTASDHDAKLKEFLRGRGLEVRSFNGRLLREPWEVRTEKGGCYKVFTPYWNRAKRMSVARPAPTPKRLLGPAKWPRSLAVQSLPAAKVTRACGQRLGPHWQPGEPGAQNLLKRVNAEFVTTYPDGRDSPPDDATTRLSPHLHFGELGPNRLFAALRKHTAVGATHARIDGVDAIRRQIGWRDFTYHLLHHFPHTPDAPLREEFARVTWRRDATGLEAWSNGLTGYPIVDAGMRQLAETGWMHNRVRMIVGSFLTKDLLIDWREGARMFWDGLVDADLANNTFGWQWVAGCGADAAPYFRIFNPVLQAKRYDPEGTYVRRWIPEIAGLPDRYIHEPWTTPEQLLKDAKVKLGHNYPRPIVDHAMARKRALHAFAVLKS